MAYCVQWVVKLYSIDPPALTLLIIQSYEIRAVLANGFKFL